MPQPLNRGRSVPSTMHTLPRVPAFFGALLLLVAVAATPVQAGASGSAEVTDAINDQTTVEGNQPTCATPVSNICFSNADIVEAWIDQETATSFQVHIRITGTGAPSTLGTSYTWDFHMTVGGTEYLATAHLNGVASAAGGVGPADGSATFSGAASSGNIETADTGGTITMTILKSAIGDPAGGKLTSLFVQADGFLASNNEKPSVRDRAPSGDAFGTDYELAGSTGGGNSTTGNGTATDTDADGLNDTWEQEKLGGLSQNGTADPDSDGCDNTCEFGHNSDPNKADTDGDGYSDGDEVDAGYSPSDATSHPGMGGTPPSGTGSGTSGPSATDSATSGTESGNATNGPETKKGPALGWVVLMTAFVVAALVRRRL